jgi:hypothetical protein
VKTSNFTNLNLSAKTRNTSVGGKFLMKLGGLSLLFKEGKLRLALLPRDTSGRE